MNESEKLLSLAGGKSQTVTFPRCHISKLLIRRYVIIHSHLHLLKSCHRVAKISDQLDNSWCAQDMVLNDKKKQIATIVLFYTLNLNKVKLSPV